MGHSAKYGLYIVFCTTIVKVVELNKFRWDLYEYWLTVNTTHMNSAFHVHWSASLKWLANTINLLAAEETNSSVNNIISNHFLVYWQK